MATARKAIGVTPHATDPLPHGTATSLYVGGAGTVVCKTDDGDANVTFTAPVGGYILVRVTHVRAASTATGIVALY